MAYHSDLAFELHPWPLGDLTRVANPAHLAYVMPLVTRDDLSSGDNSEPSNDFEYDMSVTTFYRGTHLPRIWASMPVTGPPPPAGDGRAATELVQERRVTPRRNPAPDLGRPTSWWVRAWGFVDQAASHCYLSRSHAEKLRLDLEQLDEDISFTIVGLTNRPGRVRELHSRIDRSSFYGLGETPI